MSQPRAEQHKILTRHVRQRLAAIGLQVGYNHALEGVAALHGLPNWRTLRASPGHTLLPTPAAGVALARCLHQLGYTPSETQLDLIRLMLWSEAPQSLSTTPIAAKEDVGVNQPHDLLGVIEASGINDGDICLQRRWPIGLPHLEAIFDHLPPATWIYEDGQADETNTQRMARALRNERRTNRAYKSIQKLIGARLARDQFDRERTLEQTFGIRLDHVYPWVWQERQVILNQPYDQALPTPAGLTLFDQRYDELRAAGWHVETSLRSIHYPGWTVTALLVSP